MKKLLLLSMLSFGISFAQAQNSSDLAKLNDKAIVMDENGNVILYENWFKLIETGRYAPKLLRMKGETPVFELYYMSSDKIEEHKLKRLELANTLPNPPLSKIFENGQKFSFEKMRDLNGKKYNFKKDTGNVVVFLFWNVDSKFFGKYIHELNALVDKYKENKEVQFIAISRDDAYKTRQFLKTIPFSYNIVPNGRFLPLSYNVTTYPTHIVVGKDGKIKFNGVGTFANMVNWLDKTISEQL